MPSTSAKQHKFMEAIAHNQAFAKKVGVPQTVGQDFSNADKGKTFKQGGNMKSDKASEMRQAKTLEKLAKEERSEAEGMAKGGMHHHHMKMAHHHLQEAMKHGGHVKKMASGGMTTGKHGIDEKSGMTKAKMGKAEVGGKLQHGEHTIQKSGHTRAMEPKMAIGGKNKPLATKIGMKRGGRAC